MALTGTTFAVLIGLLLLHYYGRRFVFDYVETYETGLRYLVLFYSPFVLYWMTRSKVCAAECGKRHQTSWLRRWMGMLLSAFATVAAVVAAPLGWVFAAVTWSGGAAAQQT